MDQIFSFIIGLVNKTGAGPYGPPDVTGSQPFQVQHQWKEYVELGLADPALISVYRNAPKYDSDTTTPIASDEEIPHTSPMPWYILGGLAGILVLAFIIGQIFFPLLHLCKTPKLKETPNTEEESENNEEGTQMTDVDSNV